jgi:inorganic triphosphatase YgiF
MSSGGKGGGGTDTGPMLEYGNKALKLQEKIYNEGKQQAQPWYQSGSSAVNQLSTLMGLTPQASASSRQSLFDQYKPQFTTTSTVAGSSPANSREAQAKAGAYYKKYGQAPPGYQLGNTLAGGKMGTAVYPISTKPTSTTSTDTAGLNAYIDNILAQQSSEAESNPLFGTLAKGFSMSDYQADPGYQFRLAEGNKALERQLNARGKTFSPEAVNALQSYGQGLASEEYGNAYGRFNQDQGNLFNRLATLSGFGQAAQAGQAAAGQNYAQSAGDLYTGMGNAITSANVAKAANSGSMFNTLLGAGAQLGSSWLMGR